MLVCIINWYGAVRAGLQALMEQHLRQTVGRRIADGYRQTPQTHDDLLGLDEATTALVLEEPW